MPHRLDMFHLIPTSAAIAALFATGIVIDGSSLIPVGTLGCAFLAAFWIGRELQRIKDSIEVLTKQGNRMEEAALQVAKLPCMVEGKICDGASEQSKQLKMKPQELWQTTKQLLAAQ